MELTAWQAAEAAGGRLIIGEKDRLIHHVSLNSGKMQGEDLFVPIIGERVDAHRFMGSAFENGAACAFTSEHEDEAAVLRDPALAGALEKGLAPCLIAVDNTRDALQRLGRWYRETRVHIPLIGVTGSVGKTTTREMVACALSAERRVYATKGNSNSQVGVPITVMETDPEAQIGVIELGMSEFGEMSRIARVAEVNAGVMTNIGVSHINQLKTQENILKEKLHILDGMPEGAPLILNGDDPLLAGLTEEGIHQLGIAEGKHIRIIFYGFSERADWRITGLRLEEGYPAFLLRDPRGGEIACRLQVSGDHMVRNAAAAIAAADCFGVAPEAAARALSGFTGVGGRGQKLSAGGITWIDDSYNAAPDSMKAGLSVLGDQPAAGRRVAVLADMLELGEQEAEYHRQVGLFLREKRLPIDMVFLYGPLSRFIAEGISGKAGTGSAPEAGWQMPEICLFETKEDLAEALSNTLKPGDAVLFKGSNSMGLTPVLKQLLEKAEAGFPEKRG